MQLLTRELIEQWDKNPNSNQELKMLGEMSAAYNDASFPMISDDVKQLFSAHICQTWEKTFNSVRTNQLQFLRIIFRDRENTDLECFQPILKLLICAANLSDEIDSSKAIESVKVTLESEKCLVNLLFNSSKARAVFQNSAFEQLIYRISKIAAYYEDTCKSFENCTYLNEWVIRDVEELLLYDLKIVFILTALTNKLRNDCLNDAEKMMAFLKIFTFSIRKLTNTSTSTGSDAFSATIYWKYANEVLKILFNIFHSAKIVHLDTAKNYADECSTIVQNRQLDMETKQNAVNLLAVLPTALPSLCPKIDLKIPTDDTLSLEGCDMRFVNSLLQAFESQIDEYEKGKILAEYLSTFLTVLNCLCNEHKVARRYCRMKVVPNYLIELHKILEISSQIIPPLKAEHVERRPEEGANFRNKIVRLMRGGSRCSELAAEFLFVLCKRSVNRLIKYCGFGHSAGLLANYGLLGQATSVRERHPSDSENSETEDYLQIEQKINPVTGAIPSAELLEEHRQQLESMSEEQREYEAMKLAECMDKLMDRGLISPAILDEEGRPRQVKHVAELIKDVKDESEHDESD